MGMITDFFLANDAELARVIADERLDDDGGLAIMRSKNQDPVRLDALAEALGLDEDVSSTPPLTMFNDGEAMVFELAPALCTALAGLDDVAVDDAGARWAASERVSAESIPHEGTRQQIVGSVHDADFIDTVRQMRALFQKADGRRAFLYLSV